MKSKTKPFLIARQSRPGKNALRIADSKKQKNGIGLIYSLGNEVIGMIPHSEKLDLTKEAYDKRKDQGMPRLAERALTIERQTCSFHCVERCNTALALLRAANVNCWLARHVYLDSSGKFGIHDYVEFFQDRKIHTLAFGKNSVSVFDFPANKLYNLNDGISLANLVFRGADTSHISGVNELAKLKVFLKNPVRLKDFQKNRTRLELLVSTGIMPKEALDQIKLQSL